MSVNGKQLCVSRLLKVMPWLFLVIPIFYISTCSIISYSRTRSFDAVEVGEGRNSVIVKLGAPSKIEMPDHLFVRYAATQCKTPCVKRLWYENRLAFDSEAWSVELDADDVVVHKAHWVSP